jgi:hypothetical protein
MSIIPILTTIYLNNSSSITNPDLGIVGNYNDGTYAHSGIFSDASDNHTWKVFKGYTPEPSGTIDTSHGTFTLANFKAEDITGTSFTGQILATNGVISGSSQITTLLPSGIVSGSAQIDGASLGSNKTITIAGTTVTLGGSISTDALRISMGSVVTGSAQITLSSTNGYNSVINQNLLTTSDVRHNSLGIGMNASATAGRIDASNDIVAFSTSDIRFKENITPIPNALEKISKISGNIYDWKEENKIEHGYEGNDVGVIAQEIEEVLPQLVQTRESGYKAVKYDKLVALLIEGIKELSAKVNELEKK